jgi:LysM repeat protein
VPNRPPERPNLGEFWIRCAFQSDQDKYDSVAGLMGPTPCVPQQGYGSPPLVLPLDIIFSAGGAKSIHTRRTESCETQIRNVEKLAGLILDGIEPPLVQFAANAPHDYNAAPQNLWVVDDLQWSTSAQDYSWLNNGDRSQARATAMMKLYTATELFTGHPSKNNRVKSNKAKGKQPKKKYHVVQRGETLSGIAAKYLGAASKVKELMKLNNLHDPDDIKTSQKIKLR